MTIITDKNPSRVRPLRRSAAGPRGVELGHEDYGLSTQRVGRAIVAQDKVGEFDFLGQGELLRNSQFGERRGKTALSQPGELEG